MPRKTIKQKSQDYQEVQENIWKRWLKHTKKSSNTTEPNETKGTVKTPIDWTRVGVSIGVIASIIAIIGFASGIQSIPQFISFFNVNSKTPTISPTRTTIPPIPITPTMPATLTITPTPTSEILVKPLRRESIVFEITNLSPTFRLAYSFELRTIATVSTPADLVFTNCKVPSYSPNLHCDISGSDINDVGSTSLDEIEYLYSDAFDRVLSQTLEAGIAFTLRSYEGHPIKFRISNVEFSYGDTGEPVSARLYVDYVYQPNDRQDFLDK